MPQKQSSEANIQQAGERPCGLLRPCSLLRRGLIMTYDAVVVIALMMIATFVALLLQFNNVTAGKDPLYTLYLLLVWFLYLAWCWQHGGMTLGMRAWRVKLIADDGNAFGWTRSASRFGVALLAAVPLGAGFAWSLFDKDKRTWHDRASHSRLVST